MLLRKHKYLAEAGEAPTEAEGTTEVTDPVEGDVTPTPEEVTDPVEGDVTPETKIEGEAPEGDYESFEMPEGVEVDNQLLEVFAPIMKDLNLSQEQAQKLAAGMGKIASESQQSQVDAFNLQSEQWMDQAKADKEYGGDNFDQSMSHAHNAIESFGTPELRQVFEEYRMGNHPEIIRFMVKVGKATAEDKPGGNGSHAKAKGDHASILYPTT